MSATWTTTNRLHAPLLLSPAKWAPFAIPSRGCRAPPGFLQFLLPFFRISSFFFFCTGIGDLKISDDVDVNFPPLQSRFFFEIVLARHSFCTNGREASENGMVGVQGMHV